MRGRWISAQIDSILDVIKYLPTLWKRLAKNWEKKREWERDKKQKSVSVNTNLLRKTIHAIIQISEYWSNIVSFCPLLPKRKKKKLLLSSITGKFLWILCPLTNSFFQQIEKVSSSDIIWTNVNQTWKEIPSHIFTVITINGLVFEKPYFHFNNGNEFLDLFKCFNSRAIKRACYRRKNSIMWLLFYTTEIIVTLNLLTKPSDKPFNVVVLHIIRCHQPLMRFVPNSLSWFNWIYYQRSLSRRADVRYQFPKFQGDSAKSRAFYINWFWFGFCYWLLVILIATRYLLILFYMVINKIVIIVSVLTLLNIEDQLESKTLGRQMYKTRKLK